MLRVWTASADSADELAGNLESFLNEFAADVVSVSYTVTEAHHVLVVYRPFDLEAGKAEETAVALAEQIIDEAEVSLSD
jgi:hypothetical protein